MTRRCSQCSNNGHNTRTCPGRGGGGGGVRLFGVRITEGVGAMPMKKSASMGNLTSAAVSAHLSSATAAPGSPSSDRQRDHSAGYASDDPAHASCSSNCRSDRKKGIPWTEEEHRMFLLGLQKLGKGDWRGIARNFVVSRTPTQVASHAQKYFIRQTNASRRKRRSSLFDMIPEVPMSELPALEEQFVLHSPPCEPENQNQLPLQISQEQEAEPMETQLDNISTELKAPISYDASSLPIPVPTFYPAFVSMPFPFWPPPGLATPTTAEKMVEAHKVLKPTPILSKDRLNIDDVVGMSKLSIGEAAVSHMEPSALSFKLLGASRSRQSAFHMNPSVAVSDLSQSETNAIHAV